MLHELDIEGYAVVERLRVPFQPGLNLLTGETGSGKSIVVDCLALLFGARASAEVVRTGVRRARVSGIFDVPQGPEVLARLAQSGIEIDGDLIIERQVLSSGKSRAYVNGAPATVALLRDLAQHLGDIHGQHEQQTLLSAASQLRMLDSFAGTSPEVDGIGQVYRQWRACGDALERLRGNEQERLQRVDLLRYQAGEIRETGPEPGEDDQLYAERQRLGNVERLRQRCFEAYGAVYDSPTSASAQVKSAAGSLSSVGSVDERLQRLAESLEEARATVDDVAFEVRSYLERLEANPDRQEQVEERLASLEKLKRKYGPSLASVLAYADSAEAELASLDRSDREIERLGGELDAASRQYADRSSALSRKRQSAACELAARVMRELGDLALEKARFEIRVEASEDWGPHGLDRVAFLFSANPGQPVRPLAQVASGGELSRVALALKTCLLKTVRTGSYRRALVFDEIDTGVGGSVAAAIGRRLKQLAAGSQLLCVTHLPQIAGFADAHFQVAKAEVGGRATATVTELAEPHRVEELARMLSGDQVTDAALENARELLRSA